jgi:hypothetical protein
LALQAANQDFVNSMMAQSGVSNLSYYDLWQIADKGIVEVIFFLKFSAFLSIFSFLVQFSGLVGSTDNGHKVVVRGQFVLSVKSTSCLVRGLFESFFFQIIFSK